MTKRVRRIIIVILCLILLGGLIGLLYSPFADWYNNQHKAEIQSEFSEAIENIDNSELNAEKQAAIQYNDDLFHQTTKLFDPYKKGYSRLLNVTGNGIMGIIRIPCIDVSLPIYHDVTDAVLARGVGHLPQTSLPIGGENTHAALSAHSGLASSSLFSELERVLIGDYFYIDVLGETLTYQVDQINVVLPEESKLLRVEEGRDLVTLITCTPYSVNTHRLLVRGTRVFPEEGNSDVTNTVPEENRGMSVRTKHYILGIAIGCILGAFLVFICAIVVIIWSKRRKNAKDSNGKTVPPQTIDPVTHKI